ncbi:MAG TPA: complex I subunit 1 family protein [Acidobacteriota bacterium]|nr:complex I subunit 1 family protein [Acidobacteriota bacterium]
MSYEFMAIEFAKVTFLFSVVMGFASILSWVERKQSALMQDRIGANRAEIFGFRLLGLFHILADGIKGFAKQDFIPPKANKVLHTIAPALGFTFAILAFAAIPFGGVYTFGETTVNLQVFDINSGLLMVFAFMSLGIYGFVLAGWASYNNYATLGGLRAGSQMISYEITMGATLIGALMIYGSVQLQEIVFYQGELLWGWLPKWGIILQPLGAILFMTAALAETKRVPFDVPEGESEIVGYFVEYSGMKFLLFFMTDFIETVLAAALTTTLFLGGWQVPYLLSDGFHFPWGGEWLLPVWIVLALQVGAFLFKVAALCFFFMFIRWTLPRFRWDQLMRLGWTIMLPLSILNIMVTALVVLLVEG